MHKQLRSLDYRHVVKILRLFGFVHTRTRGSHERWEKETARGAFRVSVQANAKQYILPTLKSMIDQSGYSEGEWVKALGEI